ncbi:MAG: type II secretion system minor pseudopilin GspK [Xanthomonadales bacterium]|nr:type II secretion system minor pseudopilin GspK [Xanthomonadales bacterium]
MVRQTPRIQQGVAMLMALVMMAIASSLAVYMWYQGQLNLARIHNIKQTYQAKHYTQGLLLWASDILRADYEQGETQSDSNNDAWLQGIQGMLVEDAILSGSLLPMDNKFNVNNLVINNAISQPHLQYFRRLLSTLEIDLAIAEKIIDWIDLDQIPQAGGAEDFIYLAKSPPYITGSKHFQHIRELALLDGIDYEDYQKLIQYVTVLPLTKGQATKMNVNTLSPPLLKALNLAITNEMALQLNQSNTANFSTMDDFFAHNSVQYVLFESSIKNEIRELADVKTLWLHATSSIQMEQQVFQSYALLKRNLSGDAQVIYRSLTPLTP